MKHIKKSFDAAATQLERIYKLYLKGYGTKSLIEKAESFMSSNPNVGLCF